jgi:hypothetical protein
MRDDEFTRLFGDRRSTSQRNDDPDPDNRSPASHQGTASPATEAAAVRATPTAAAARPAPQAGAPLPRGHHPVIKVTEVDSGTLALPRRRYGQSTLIPVSALALTWSAVATGGALPQTAHWWSRFMFRMSSIANLWACVEEQNGEWRATTLYQKIETSDKGQCSYRVGTIMTGIAAKYSLDLVALIHRQTQFSSSNLSRADFIARRPSDRSWHGIEAKGLGPDLNTGQPQTPTPKKLAKAKDQGRGLGAELRARPLPVGADDHWAVHSLAATTDVFELLIEDPSAGGDEPPGPLDPEIGFDGDDPEERLLQNFFQLVGDIEVAREFSSSNVRGEPQPLPGYRGFRMPGTAFWLGAREELFDARREQRLSGVIDEITATPLVDEPAVYADLGLAVVVLSVAGQ